MPDIGYYTVPVILSARGSERAFSNDLNRSFGRTGTTAGKNLVTSASKAIASDKSIERATANKAKAVDNLANAVGRARTAEASLTQARTGGNQARIVAAEERLATARRKTVAETRALTSATSQLDSAVKSAGQSAQNAGSSGGSNGAMGLMLLGRGGMSGITALSGSAGTAAGMAAKAGIAGVLTVAAGAALFAPIIAGFKLFNWGAEVGLPMERQLNTLQGVTNATKVQMAAAGAETRRLGSDIQLSGTTASDAAAAMTELAKGGLSIQDAMKAARGTVQLATAGQLDAAQAAQYQTAAMNMFSLGADKATHVADLLAAAANSSSAEVSDIGMALQQGGSVAAGFGLSLEETVATLASFSKMGINGSDAGTMMKTSMQAITDQGKPAQEAINELGLKLYDTTGRFVGYTDMMRQVAEASTRMTQEQFQAATAILFGSDAMRASMIAAKGGPELFQDTADAMANVDGAAARMAGSQMQGLPGVVEGLDNTMASLRLSVYDAGNAIMTSLGQEALGSLNGFAGWISDHQPQIIGFFTTVGTMAVSGLRDIVQFAAEGSRALAQLVNALGDTLGGIQRAYAASQRLLGRTAEADKADHLADQMFGWGDGGYAAADALDALLPKMDDFQNKLQTAGDRANDASKLTVALGKAVASVPDGKDIVITDNTPETTARLQALGIDIVNTPTGIKITATTDDAKRIIAAWRAQQGLEPVEIQVTPRVDPSFAANFRAMLTGAAAGVPVTPSGPGALDNILLPVPRARGAVTTAFARMPSKAVIQPATRGLVQWAEPSTHGEAFIPLNPGNRARSRAIHAETGRRLGVRGFEYGAITLPDVQAAMGMEGTGYSQPGRTDCSGMAARVILRALGLPASGGLMTTKNARDWLAKYGFRDGTGGPGSMSVGWYDNGGGPNSGHMAMTLSNGMNAEAGGSSGKFTVGGSATGANDPKFTQHMFLPLDAMYPQGPGGSGGGFGAMTGGAASGGGYVVDQQKVADAQEKVRAADADVAIQQQQLNELKADATESQKMAANEQLRKAKVDAADARADLQKSRQGEYQKGDSGTGSGQGPQLGEVGSIMSQFMKDTFGLGDLLPDPSQLGIVKLLGAIMGIKYTPQGKGFPWQTGAAGSSLPGAASPFGGQVADPLATATSMLPFGMGALMDAIPDAMTPGTTPPPMPVDGAHLPAGGPTAPGPTQSIDQSNHVTVNGYSDRQVVGQVRRQLQWAPRTQTYAPPGSG